VRDQKGLAGRVVPPVVKTDVLDVGSHCFNALVTLLDIAPHIFTDSKGMKLLPTTKIWWRGGRSGGDVDLASYSSAFGRE
jgi:hypothetical protein